MNRYKSKKINGTKYDVHRLVFEKHLGRPLDKNEVVHHIDGDKANNKLSNLMLFPNRSAHTKYHFQHGDLELKSGKNKKKLINGKLRCCRCSRLKELGEFAISKNAHLGVVGRCRNCDNLRRRR